MLILSIDTSCDDTAIAVIKATERKKIEFEILANVVLSQVKVHRKHGGVHPTLAIREHQRNLVPVLRQALLEARLLKIKDKKIKAILRKESALLNELSEFLRKYQRPEIDLIAVTIGPGLEPCLWQGVNFAKSLGCAWQKPLIPVNHLEAHIVANWLTPITSGNFKSQTPNSKNFGAQARAKHVSGTCLTPLSLFPAICLIVSGGHTQLVLMNSVRGQRNLIETQRKQTSNGVKGFGRYKILGETRDDAAGECFDKTARVLGLGYPGGPEIAKRAASKNGGDRVSAKLPRPMMYSRNYDFSFSGLKTAVLYNYKKQASETRRSKIYIQAMAKEIQQAIIDVLITKTIKAVKEYRAKSIILGGGVAANTELCKQFKSKVKSQKLKVKIWVPPKNLCTDNAAMVAGAGYYAWLRGKTKRWEKIEAKANLRLS